MRKLLALLLAAMTIAGTAAPAMAAEDAPPATVSKAYVVMDAKTGQVLLQKNMYEKKYPASITKILTTALGLTETHFTNAHGLPDPEHYTTAYDMARITRWAMTVPGFEEYFCATEYSIPRTNKKNVQRNIGTHHHMLVESAYYYPYAKGGKLGWTTEAQHTAVTWAEKDGLSLLCVVLDCSDKWGKYKDTAALFDYCFERYSMVSVKTDDIAAYDIPVGSLTKTVGMVHIAAGGDIDVLVPKGTAVESIALKYQIPGRYRVNERIDPQVELWCGGELVGSFPMTYTVETYAPAEPPAEDTAAGGSVIGTVLKWAGIVLGALVVLLFTLRAHFMAKRRRARQRRRQAQRHRTG